MPRTTITAVEPPNGYPSLPLAANAADYTYTAADVANKNQTPHTGRELLLARNTGATVARNITITSAEDAKRRTGHITNFSLGIGEFAAFGPFPIDGWRQADGNLYFEADNAEVTFAVIRLGRAVS